MTLKKSAEKFIKKQTRRARKNNGRKPMFKPVLVLVAIAAIVFAVTRPKNIVDEATDAVKSAKD